MATRSRRKQQAAQANQTTLSSFYGGGKSRAQQIASNDCPGDVQGLEIATKYEGPINGASLCRRECVVSDDVGSEEDIPSPPASYTKLPSLHPALEPPVGTRLRRVFDLPVPELPVNYRRVNDTDDSLKPYPKVTGPLDRLFGGSIKSANARELAHPRSSTPEFEMHNAPGPTQSENNVREPSIIELTSPPPKSLSHPEVPTIVLDSPPRTRREMKMAHPFFLPEKSRSVTSEVIDLEDDLPQEKPKKATAAEALIDLTESPVKSRASPSNTLERPSKKGTPRGACWPTLDMQHVRPPCPGPFSSATCPFPSRMISNQAPSFTPSFTIPLPNLASSSHSIFPLFQEHRPLSDPIPDEHLMHPALSRLKACSESWQFAHANHQWVDKYKPTRANQVIGNERNAQYLKEWLQALRLTFQEGESSSHWKRSRVRRAADKAQERAKKRRKKRHVYGDTDWIVDSGEEEDVPSGEDDNPSFCEDSVLLSPIRATPGLCASKPPPDLSPTFDFSTNLSNALLLTGPHGSGKTAAVYACAEELGWEVFEVNPGTGKRSGSLLANLAEGVGKNHTLGSVNNRQMDDASVAGKKTSGSHAFFGRPKRKTGEDTSRRIASTPIEVDPSSDDIDIIIVPDNVSDTSSDELNVRSAKRGSDSRKDDPKKLNQSIILLEEVDVLFQGEGNFWSMVIHIIGESRRPVIMTCNDPLLVPAMDLPLQMILHFVSCPEDLATSYLRLLVQVECEDDAYPDVGIRRLYKDTAPERLSFNWPDQPLHPMPSESLVQPDLRKAIMQAQFLCNVPYTCDLSLDAKYIDLYRVVDDSAKGGSKAIPQSLNNAGQLRSLFVLSDAISFSDCIGRRAADGVEAWDNDDYDLHQDSDLDSQPQNIERCFGHYKLLKPQFPETSVTVPLHYHGERRTTVALLDNAMDTALQMERMVFNYRIQGERLHQLLGNWILELADLRAEHQSQTLRSIEHLLVLPGPLFPRSEIFLDYIPHLRWMVHIDDKEEAEEAEQFALAQEASKLAGGRLTRNSRAASGLGAQKKQPFVRNIRLNEEQLSTLRNSEFQLIPA